MPNLTVTNGERRGAVDFVAEQAGEKTTITPGGSIDLVMLPNESVRISCVAHEVPKVTVEDVKQRVRDALEAPARWIEDGARELSSEARWIWSQVRNLVDRPASTASKAPAAAPAASTASQAPAAAPAASTSQAPAAAPAASTASQAPAAAPAASTDSQASAGK